MEPILNFAQLTAHLFKKLNHRKRIAVVCANDPKHRESMPSLVRWKRELQNF